jgi:UDP-glucose 4-epimerase
LFAGKTLLITGGTGTFGYAALRRFISSDIGEIRILSRDEKKQDDMRKTFANSKVKFYISDVRDEASLRDAMTGVHYVFHAAALKQVPSCEFFPIEALRTNALGTENVLNAAIFNAVERVIVVSTDKAVYPINAMGASKAMMEKLAVAKSRVAGSRTIINITRYGNVMASRGSVIPLLIHQLQEGKPLTLTDPEMTRFMMTIEDAVELVLHTFEQGRPGDLFVRKAVSTTIGTLAAALKHLLRADNRIEVIGTRHGEKLYETLLTREELAVADEMDGYFRVPVDNRDLNYAAYFSKGQQRVTEHQDYNSHNTDRLNLDATCDLLLKLRCVQQAMAGEKVYI